MLHVSAHAICQQGVRDSQAALRAAVAAVTRGEESRTAHFRRSVFPDARPAVPRHQAAALGFQGAAKTVDGKPESAFKMFVGGSDKLGAAKFGEAGAVILERDLPKLLRGPRKSRCQHRNMNWETWIAGHGDEFKAIVEKYA